uniref:Uncharacterized protein n=1 Tax=Anguilla anguilla TaxID=7936 RepID=A0A0E9UFX4_ANGAN
MLPSKRSYKVFFLIFCFFYFNSGQLLTFSLLISDLVIHYSVNYIAV